jgi:hypothetical protein
MGCATTAAAPRAAKRIPLRVIRRLCALRRERYADFSIRHFWERATEQHGLRLSYTWTRLVLQEAGLAPKAPAPGRYRRKRERRPVVGMLVHVDGSTHAWLPGLPMQDLVVALDDADGRILYAASGRRRARPPPSPRSTTCCATLAPSPSSSTVAVGGPCATP